MITPQGHDVRSGRIKRKKIIHLFDMDMSCRIRSQIALAKQSGVFIFSRASEKRIENE